MQKLILYTLVGLFFLAMAPLPAQKLAAVDIAHRTIRQTRQLKTLTYTMYKTERINGKMVKQVSANKMNRKPLKVYVKQLEPTEGMEVLYIHDSENAKALINPNGFPWINVSLAPLSSRMRKDQHHTILDSGYDHFINILEGLLTKYHDEAEKMASLGENQMYDGRKCWVLQIENPHFKYIDHTVKPGENLLNIARRYKVGEHMILEKNKGIDNYHDVHPDQVIQVPNDYSPRMVLYIDQERFIPLVMRIYDDQGLYELYEYRNVILNPDLTPEEFSEEYHAYGF